MKIAQVRRQVTPLVQLSAAPSAVVDELEREVEVLLLEQGDDGLQVVLLLRRDTYLLALNLGLHTLGALVPDGLGDLLRLVLGEPVLERGTDLVEPAGRPRFTGVERLERNAALDQLLLEDVQH